MPSIAIQAARAVVSAADANGNLTVDSTAYLFPGAYAWVVLDDGSQRARVKILAISGSTGLKVRIMPTKQDRFSATYVQSETNPPPSYGVSDMTAFNGSAHICQEAQTAPVDPAYSKRVLP